MRGDFMKDETKYKPMSMKDRKREAGRPLYIRQM
jgi:hypothetical protein